MQCSFKRYCTSINVIREKGWTLPKSKQIFYNSLWVLASLDDVIKLGAARGIYFLFGKFKVDDLWGFMVFWNLLFVSNMGTKLMKWDSFEQTLPYKLFI